MARSNTVRSQKSAGQSNGQTKRGVMTAKTFPTRHDMPPKVRQEMIALLNQQLASTFDLFSQTKQAHWNVRGAEFYQFHELFDELAEELLAMIDTIAERATALGGEALGTVRMAEAASELEEYPREIFDSLGTAALLADRYAALAHSMRQAVDAAEEAKDMGTSDLFIDVSRFLDKSLWFLEAHLQEKG